MRKGTLILLAAVLVSVPLVTFAQEDVCVQAIQDAERDIKSALWRNASCLSACLFSPVIGLGVVGLAYLVKPSVPSANLVGKPIDYVDAYTDCYQDRAKTIQTDEAMSGCMLGSISAVVFWGTITLAAILISPLFIVY